MIYEPWLMFESKQVPGQEGRRGRGDRQVRRRVGCGGGDEGRPLRRLRPRPQEQGKARGRRGQAEEAVRLRQEREALHRAVRDQLPVGPGR